MSVAASPSIRIGTAGWSIAKDCRGEFPEVGSQLVRYAARLSGVEINSSFHRHHRPETYARWAADVAEDFRFAVKLPKAITHDRRLVDIGEPLLRFADETVALGPKLGAVLVQLPPSLGFDPALAAAFLRRLRDVVSAPLVLEPRHAGWFTHEADRLLVDHRIARVAADPAPVPAAGTSGGWRGLAYFRYHGAPRIYWSGYDAAALDTQAAVVEIAAAAAETWVIYDNTAAGAATANALSLGRLLRQ